MGLNRLRLQPAGNEQMTEEAGGEGRFFYVLDDAVRILFVDDDPIMREFAGVHLSSDKASVATAADGVEAVRILGEDPAFDIVLLDLEMPLMDGFEVLSRIRGEDATMRLPVIVVTGREDVVAIDRAFQAGATSFLAKPINWRLLSYQVRYVHRTHVGEMALLRQAEQATDALKEVARDAAPLLSRIMQGPPELKRLAAEYVALLEKAAKA